MIEQIGNAVKFAAFFTASRQGKTGLTVTVDIYNPAGTLIVTAGAASALGGGIYTYVLASGSVTTEGEYYAVFKTTDTTVDAQHVPALWVVGRAGIEDLDAAISSRNATAPDNASITAIKAKTDNLPASPASTTNITAATGVVLSATTHTGATIPTVTNLTNAPTNGDLTATMKASVTTAATAATPMAAAVTGAVGSVTAAVTLPSIPAGWITAAGIAASALNGKGDWSTYAGADTPGTTTLLTRLTAIRAGYFDNLSGGAVALASGVNATQWGGVAVTGMPMPTFTYAAPDNAGIAAVKAKTDNLPADPASQSTTGSAITSATSPLATASALAAVSGYVDTEVAAIKAVTDKLDSFVEFGGGSYRYTANGLVNAPSGGGGGGTTDWTAGEREQIRDALGLAGTKTTAIGGQLQTLAGYVDTEVASIKVKTDLIPANPAATSDIPGTADIASAVWSASSRRLSAVGIQDIWDALKSAMTAPGSMGEWLANLASGGGGTAPTALENAAAVWNAIRANFNATGSMGEGISNASAAGNPWTDTGLANYPAGSAGRILNKLNLGAINTPVLAIQGHPNDPDYAYVFIDTGDLPGGLQAGISIEITLTTYPARTSRVLLTRPVKIMTGTDGRAMVALPITSAITPAMNSYILNIPAMGVTNKTFQLESTASFDLGSLI